MAASCLCPAGAIPSTLPSASLSRRFALSAPIASSRGRAGLGRFLSSPRHVVTAMASPPAALKPGSNLGKDYDKMYPPPGLKRRAGVLLHPTSLPSPLGAGDLGEEAFAFVDFLADAGFSVWQVRISVPPGAVVSRSGRPLF